ncbi:MAG: c-type cytochrome [Steroidobacter sp.]
MNRPTKNLTSLLIATALAVLPYISSLASPIRVDQQVRTALQLDRNVARGAALYAKNCARCHGDEALGSAAQIIPALAGQRRPYLLKQLADFTELERDSREMQHVLSDPKLSEPQAWADVAGYLNSLQPAHFPATGDGAGVELGEAIFHEQCASCHEQDARGDDDGFIPSLRDQHYSYLVRQIRSIAAWHRLDVDDNLVRFLDSMDTEEMNAVADYLSRMRGPVKDRSRLNDDGTVDQ